MRNERNPSDDRPPSPGARPSGRLNARMLECDQSVRTLPAPPRRGGLKPALRTASIPPTPAAVAAAIGILAALALPAPTRAASRALVISGNENKIDLVSGAPRVVRDAPPDSISILDFSTFPPAVQHLTNVPNSVLGPPSNIAITPNGRLALVANSIRIEPTHQTNWLPEDFLHLLDLTTRPPRVVGRVAAGPQPSGISIRRDGALALVANRAGGSISVLDIDGASVRLRQTLPIAEPADSVSDVAISPDGRLVLASVQKAGYLAVLRLDGNTLTNTGHKLSACGQPYRCVITPDGALGLTAGMGAGNGLDHDALTVVDLKSEPPRTVDYVTLGAVPESIELDPGGQVLAAVLMNGSNFPPGDPKSSPHGELVLLRRGGGTFRVTERHRIGRIPEGVAFTSDGRYLVVQCHPDRELWVFAMKRGRARDTGHRVKVPGLPSGLRAAP